MITKMKSDSRSIEASRILCQDLFLPSLRLFMHLPPDYFLCLSLPVTINIVQHHHRLDPISPANISMWKDFNFGFTCGMTFIFLWIAGIFSLGIRQRLRDRRMRTWNGRMPKVHTVCRLSWLSPHPFCIAPATVQSFLANANGDQSRRANNLCFRSSSFEDPDVMNPETMPPQHLLPQLPDQQSCTNNL